MPSGSLFAGKNEAVSGSITADNEYFDSFSPLVEQLSVDEAFLDISGMELLAGSERDIGFKVKRSIKEKTGLTASVGIAPNKFWPNWLRICRSRMVWL